MSQPIGVVGFRGYSGREAVNILAKHPNCFPVLLDHRDERINEATLWPSLRCVHGLAEAVSAEGLSGVLLATPPEVSIDLVPKFLETGAVVIDLSGAFRLPSPEQYERWYGVKHTAPHLLGTAAYGLPEFCRDRVRTSRFISNPGCYPTAANLALRPLVQAGIVDRASGIVCDAKSGVSGAGRKPSLKTSFCEVFGNFAAYAVLQHRHVPEILQISGIDENELSFTAQLLPIDRGILETLYFRLSEGMSSSEVTSIYQECYAAEPFIRVRTDGRLPELAAVQHTNFCDVGVISDSASRRCVVISAIDNLVKGAAGQAIQNLNLALGFDETAGLL